MIAFSYNRTTVPIQDLVNPVIINRLIAVIMPPIFSSLNPALIPTRIQFLCLFQRIFGFINTIQAKFFRKKLVQIFNRNLFPCLECHDVGIAFCTASNTPEWLIDTFILNRLGS